MGFNYDISKVIDDYKSLGGKTLNEKWLKYILSKAKKDSRLKNIKHLAYLLATGKVESDYSVERWEGDYLCGKIGQRYVGAPCDRALNYFRSTSGKKNYYDLGTDDKGLPYFGRGLIQLTGKHNYDKIGRKIGLGNRLVANPELIFEPKNSYDSAVEILDQKKAGKSVFDLVDEGDLVRARKWVNGGIKKLQEVNDYYARWLKVLGENNRKEIFSATAYKTVGISTIAISLIIFSVGVWYFKKS